MKTDFKKNQCFLVIGKISSYFVFCDRLEAIWYTDCSK